MTDNQNHAWWSEENATLRADSVAAFVKFLETDQSYKQTENIKFMRLYGNWDLANMKSYAHSRVSDAGSGVKNRITMNIVQSMIDTVVSKITKNRPKPTFLTEGGDFTQQRRAQKLTQFIEGQFHASEFYAKAAIAFLDACIFGTGALKIFRRDGDIVVERVFIDEIKIDDREAIYGRPRQMHQTKYIHKDVLKGMFPAASTIIESAASINLSSTDLNVSQNQGDMILVTESWHLKSAEDAKDGKHTISMPGHEFFCEQYDREYFPFVFWRWGTRPIGFFGQGIAEQLQGLQLEINKILRTIQVSMHLVSVPKLYVEAGSKVIDAHLDNRIGSIIRYAGTPPTPGQLGVIPRELFDHLDRLYQRAYEIVGVSQLSANQKKPSGLDSGKAMREYNDLETERFMSVAQRYEQAYLDAVPIFIDLIKEIDAEYKEQGKSYKVKVKGRKFLKTIKWKDVSMDEDQYEMAIFPTSALSSTPAGRLQDVQELIALGWVSREDGFKLLDLPDLQSFYNFETAPGEDIDMVIEKIIDDSDYMPPEPYQDLDQGIKKMQKAYLLFRSQNCPEPKLELIRRWIEDARALMERAAVDTARQQLESEAGINAMAQQQLDEKMPPTDPAAPADAAQNIINPDQVPPGPVVV